MLKPCICAQLQPNYLHSFHWKLFDFPWQRAMNELYAKDGSGVLCSPAESYCVLAGLSPCSQEEADTRLLLDAADVAQKECKKVTILTVDTDVVIFAVASFSKTVFGCIWRRVKLSLHSCS